MINRKLLKMPTLAFWKGNPFCVSHSRPARPAI